MRRQLRRCRFSGSLRSAAAIVRDALADTRTSHVRAPPHPRHFVPICSFGRPRSSSRAVFFRLFRRHRCLALGSNGLWQLDVPPRMHPSAVTAQALVQQTSFRTPRFSCWCAGSSAGAHSRCSGAQSRPPCGLRRSCSDLVSIARPNRTIACILCAGFAGRVATWLQVLGSSFLVAIARRLPQPSRRYCSASCSCAGSSAGAHSRCRLPVHVIVAVHVQPGETESQPAVLERKRYDSGKVR